MLRDVPEGWAELALGDIFARDTPGFWGDDEGNECTMKVLRATNLKKDGTLNYSTAAVRSFPEKKASQKALQDGDIILERSGGSPTQPVGRVAYFQGGEGFSASNFMQIIRADEQKAEGVFCYYWMDWFYKKGGTELLQKATTGIRNLDYQVYKSTLVKLPPLPEQRRIAEILSSVDEAIQATQAVIEQTRKVKNGVLERLLTKGIGHTRFKQTEIGEVPEGWSVKRLGDVIRLTSGKLKSVRSLSSAPSSSTPFPVYGGNGVAGYDSDFLIDGANIIIGRVGEYCGSVYRANGQVWVTDNALYTKQFLVDVSPDFLAHVISGIPLEKIRGGGGQPLISQKPLYEVEIALPPASEQRQIASMIQSFDNGIETARLSRLRSIKQALSGDLLAGRRRTSTNLPLAAE